jgi:hypothetical protein
LIVVHFICCQTVLVVILKLKLNEMPNFSNQELTDTILIYGEALGNASQARILYGARYPCRVVPNTHTFQAIVQQLRDHGSFNPQVQVRGRARPRRILNVEANIRNAVAARPGTSTFRMLFKKYSCGH